MRTQIKTDLEILHTINREIKAICERNGIKRNFTVDNGYLENAITQTWWGNLARADSWETDVFVPDLLDYSHREAIEYQEEAAKTGKHTVKGHDEFSDKKKDEFYKNVGINQLKIWSSEFKSGIWKNKLERWLLNA